MKRRTFSYTSIYRRRRHPLRWILSFLLVCVLFFAGYVLIDSGRLEVVEQPVLISDLPQSMEGVRIVLLSDLHGKRFGPQNEQLAQLINNTRCSAVVCCGDMVGESGNPTPFYELISALNMPVYFIDGNSDPIAVGAQQDGSHSVLADWSNGAQVRGATYLSSPAILNVQGGTLCLSPSSLLGINFEQTLSAYLSDSSASSEYRAEKMQETLTRQDTVLSSDLHLVLSHEPLTQDSALRLLTSDDPVIQSWSQSVDLLLCGGTCGGQWRLPGIGGVYYQGWFPDDQLLRGYSYAGPLLRYVTSGLSADPLCPLPSFRLFNTPEIVVLTFTSQADRSALPL